MTRVVKIVNIDDLVNTPMHVDALGIPGAPKSWVVEITRGPVKRLRVELWSSDESEHYHPRRELFEEQRVEPIREFQFPALNCALIFEQKRCIRIDVELYQLLKLSRIDEFFLNIPEHIFGNSGCKAVLVKQDGTLKHGVINSSEFSVSNNTEAVLIRRKDGSKMLMSRGPLAAVKALKKLLNKAD